MRFEGEEASLTLGLCGTEKVTLYSDSIDVGDYNKESTPEPIDLWLDALRKRNPSETLLTRGCHAAQLGELINITYGLQRPLSYLPGEHHFLDDALANRHLKQAGRGPWRI